ncbi:MAG: glycerophosphodiester phosphodiesterase [Acidimicrobiaceae bacterium]|nr:glycerophosphodiester phosphodiesterase [Acidimicrobiaceae bacterium]
MRTRGLHPYLDDTGPVAFAHRGGAEEHPENSLAAFRHAVSLGYRHLETDVHLTADGVVLAFHDDSLDRVTDRSGRISELTAAEVARARIAGTEPIPTLDALLEEFPDARINIDPKGDPVVEPLAKALGRHDALDRVCVGSFSDRRLRRLRGLLGDRLCTSAGPVATAAFRLASLGLPLPRGAHDCLQVPVRQSGILLVDRRFVALAHRRGLKVHVWTIDDPDEMHRLFDLGVDGLMTDRPTVLRDVLRARGRWAD